MRDKIEFKTEMLKNSSYSPNSHTENSCYGRLYSIYIRRRIEGKLKLIKIGLLCDGCSQVSFDENILRENLFLNPKKV
jgi:hypothetical protein